MVPTWSLYPSSFKEAALMQLDQCRLLKGKWFQRPASLIWTIWVANRRVRPRPCMPLLEKVILLEQSPWTNQSFHGQCLACLGLPWMEHSSRYDVKYTPRRCAAYKLMYKPTDSRDSAGPIAQCFLPMLQLNFGPSVGEVSGLLVACSKCQLHANVLWRVWITNYDHNMSLKVKLIASFICFEQANRLLSNLPRNKLYMEFFSSVAGRRFYLLYSSCFLC